MGAIWKKLENSGRGAEGDFGAHGGAAAGLALEFESAVQLADAFPHVDQAQPSRFRGPVGSKTDAIV